MLKFSFKGQDLNTKAFLVQKIKGHDVKGITGWGPNGQELEGVGVKVKSQRLRSLSSWLLRLSEISKVEVSKVMTFKVRLMSQRSWFRSWLT